MGNEFLSYDAPENQLLSWEFSNPQLSVQVTAFLATLLAFQLSGLFHDFLLGMKTKNVSAISDLHATSLVRRSSLLAVASNLLRRDWLTRLYYSGQIPRNIAVARDPQRIKPGVATKLLFLLAVAPVCNIASVVLSLRTETKLTFKEVGFAGITLNGIADVNLSAFPQAVDNCTRLPLMKKPGDTSLVQFTLCSKRVTLPIDAYAPLYAYAGISLLSNNTFIFNAAMASVEKQIWKSLTMYTNKTLYAVKALASLREAEYVVDAAIAMLGEECGLPNGNEKSIQYDRPNRVTNAVSILTKRIPCPRSTDSGSKISRTLAVAEKHIGLVKTRQLYIGEMDLENASNVQPFFSAEDILLISRIRKRISLASTLIAFAVAIALRLIANAFLNSDTDIGLERIVKARLGFECCQSLLRKTKENVQYDVKCQMGSICHYGLQRDGMEVVRGLEDGIVGGEYEEGFKGSYPSAGDE